MSHADRSFRIRVLLTALLGAGVAACSQKSRCVTEGVLVEVSGDPTHSVTVPAVDVKKGALGAYAVKGQGHEHALALKEDDMQKLQRGEPVATRTSSVNGHVHEVSVRCKP